MMTEYRDDAVLIGGWVPDILFPDVTPPHVGSIDVDLALELQRDGYESLVALLKSKGFRRGPHPYQFVKEMPGEGGRPVLARLDLLTSQAHHAKYFSDIADTMSPQPIPGAEIAFAQNEVRPVGDGEVKVAGIVAFVVMKSIALHERINRKDAYDLHFCLEHYPDGLDELALLFRAWGDDPLVTVALDKLARKFKDPDDDGPCTVADVEDMWGEIRAIRKQQVFLRVHEFLEKVRGPARTSSP